MTDRLFDDDGGGDDLEQMNGHVAQRLLQNKTFLFAYLTVWSSIGIC